jgi:short-subunit dehydrogenase
MNTHPVALVTGASSGIGAATAAALVKKGFVVVGTSRNASKAAPVEGVTMIDLDIASDAAVTTAVEGLVADHGRIDVLVNNAGIGSAGAAEESSIGQAQHLFDVNVFGAMRMTNAVLPHMRRQGAGRIITVSSVLGLVPAPYMALYSATKHALEGYCESVDHEVREHGVRVLLVEPAYTRTAFEANTMTPDQPLDLCHARRASANDLAASAIESGDDPSVVAKVIVDAATTTRPRLRYPAGSVARQVTLLRRLAPAAAFDKQIRKLNKLPA